MKPFATLFLLTLLSISLVGCGQKGGLTRPEPASFVIAAK